MRHLTVPSMHIWAGGGCFVLLDNISILYALFTSCVRVCQATHPFGNLENVHSLSSGGCADQCANMMRADVGMAKAQNAKTRAPKNR